MKVIKYSTWSGQLGSMDLPVTLESITRWQDGEDVTTALEDLTYTQKEFIFSGATEEEQSEIAHMEFIVSEHVLH
tara:strand:+ start:962 stop:1186 length:225 start_codon:yes stop_codon:yes gene_type:complete